MFDVPADREQALSMPTSEEEPGKKRISRRKFVLLGSAGASGAGGIWKYFDSRPRRTSDYTDSSGPRPSPLEPDLTVALIGHHDEAAWESLRQAFRAKQPDLSVYIDSYPGGWREWLERTRMHTTRADVFITSAGNTQFLAKSYATPLDSFVKRNAASLQEYFDDVPPSLVEAFMYQGSLFQLPINFTVTNLYVNTAAMTGAGIDYPEAGWTHEDFLAIARQMRSLGPDQFVPYYWSSSSADVGILPWLYINDTSFFVEEKSDGGQWLWQQFYRDVAANHSGGYLWRNSNISDKRVAESFEFVRALIEEGLGSNCEDAGEEYLRKLTSNTTGMGLNEYFSVEDFHEAGVTPADYDVAYFPKWRSQRHQFEATGCAIHRHSTLQEEAWEWIKFCISQEGMRLLFPNPSTTPARRSICNETFYSPKGPAHWKVFHDTLEQHPCVPIPNDLWRLPSESILAALNGSAASLPAALSQIDAEFTEALKK